MLVFEDLIFGDELFSDSCKPKLEESGMCFTFESKLTTEKAGDIDESLLGANASQEEQAEECESSCISGFDFVLRHRLCEVVPAIATKKDFQLWAKKVFKVLLNRVQRDSTLSDEEKTERTENIKRNGPEFVKRFAPIVKDLSFYGAPANDYKMDDEGECVEEAIQGNVVMVQWGEDGTSGTCYCFKEALKITKY